MSKKGKVTLRKVGVEASERWLAMQVETFTPFLEKYEDHEIDPATESLEKVRSRFQPWQEHFYIELNGEVVGGIRSAWWVKDDGSVPERYRLGNMMILPQYQNLGIGQEAVRLLEAQYPNAISWELDTLLQEERNLYFYEKLGYVRVGEPHVVNEKLSLVYYKKWLNPLAAYYDRYDENGRLEAKHGQVEFLTTMRYIRKYLQEGMKVIEIGAGTGRYSRAIADMGYCVEAIELNARNIEIFKANLKPNHKINITQCNALDLAAFENEEFDITLVLGPLYHLYTEHEKRQVIAEALRVTKSGGIVFAAYCISDGSLIWSGFQRKVFDIADYIRRGKIDPVTFDTTSVPDDVFELIRKEDIDKLMSGFAVRRLHYVASDLYTNYMREAVDAMDDDTFALYLRYHFAICEREDMVGITHHSLDVFQKGAVV